MKTSISYVWRSSAVEWQKPGNKAFSFVCGKGLAHIIMVLLQPIDVAGLNNHVACCSAIWANFKWACHIRKAILSSVCKWESILEAPDNSDSVSRHWFQLIEDSNPFASLYDVVINERKSFPRCCKLSTHSN
ncbi:hypothetical protein CsSME_00052271 [Camellia sinensis var. sinensis]